MNQIQPGEKCAAKKTARRATTIAQAACCPDCGRSALKEAPGIPVLAFKCRHCRREFKQAGEWLFSCPTFP